MKKAIIALLSLTFLFLGYFPAELSAKKSKKEKTNGKYTRIYSKQLSSQNQKDINHIVKTLGLGNVKKIIGSRDSMKKAGDRIRTVHPLKFLGFVFSNEELKACAHNIRHSNIPFVWSEFWGGLRDSLADETKLGNITQVQIADFSNKVGIDQAIIAPSIEAQKWQEFFDLLLKHSPRNENTNRYNI